MIDVIYELSTMRPILTGPAEKIREHLLKASPEYADLWVLHHSESGRTVSVSEYLTFTAPKPVPVSEDRIRQIIREELANLLRSLGTTAYDLDTYLSNDVAESVALRSIKDVVEMILKRVQSAEVS